MIFSVTPDDGPPCLKCGSRSGSVCTIVSNGQKYATLCICEECIFRAVLGEMTFIREKNKALGGSTQVTPPPIEPQSWKRWFARGEA